MAGKFPAIHYYHRSDAANPETDVYLSLLQKEKKFQNIKVNTVSTDWSKVPGDKKFAPCNATSETTSRLPRTKRLSRCMDRQA